MSSQPPSTRFDLLLGLELRVIPAEPRLRTESHGMGTKAFKWANLNLFRDSLIAFCSMVLILLAVEVMEILQIKTRVACKLFPAVRALGRYN